VTETIPTSEQWIEQCKADSEQWIEQCKANSEQWKEQCTETIRTEKLIYVVAWPDILSRDLLSVDNFMPIVIGKPQVILNQLYLYGE
jgi:hypothetical protein